MKYDQLQAKIEDAHDWKDGQAYSWEACGVHGTDTCRVCGLRRKWARGGQNSGNMPDEYETHDGQELTVKQAAQLESCIEPSEPESDHDYETVMEATTLAAQLLERAPYLRDTDLLRDAKRLAHLVLTLHDMSYAEPAPDSADASDRYLAEPPE